MLVVQSIADLPYMTDLKLPIHWRDDQSGKVSGAIWAYICHCAEPKKYPVPSAEQLRMVIEYCRYYINAPAGTVPRNLPRSWVSSATASLRLPGWKPTLSPQSGSGSTTV